MKLASLETLSCDAGWRPWLFVKATTEDGLVGWSEVTDSHGSPTGLAGVVSDLAPLVVGRDPRAFEAIHWDLYRRTRQSPGSIVQKAIGGIENALLDLKGKALNVSVAELFGGPTRGTIPLYWSHCGTTRARAWEVTGTSKLDSYDAVTALGREVVESGYRAFKTNIVVPGDGPRVLMPGFGRDGGIDRNPTPELLDALTRLLEAFREGTGGKAQPIVDLNFNLTTEGIVRVARALEPFDLAWLEVDSYDAAALAHARRRSPMPLCSGENLYTLRGFRPYLEAGAMDVASVDVVWNGFAQSLKIAALAETHEVACAPHNYYSHLATFVAASGAPRSRPADARDRRRRRPSREGLRPRAPGPARRRAGRALGPRLGLRRPRGRASGSPRVVGPQPPDDRARQSVVAQPELQPGELPELVDDGVRDPAPVPGTPQPCELLLRVPRARARRAARDSSPSAWRAPRTRPSRNR